MREKQRESVTFVYVFADLVSEFEQETAEAACNGFGEGDAACVLESKAIFLADALNGAHLSFAMIAKEGEEALAFDWTKLRGCKRFGGDFVDAVGKGCIQPEDGSWTRYANDHLPVLRASCCQLKIAGANEIQAAGILALAEESRLGRKADGTRNEFQVGQNSAAERAEPARPTIGA